MGVAWLWSHGFINGWTMSSGYVADPRRALSLLVLVTRGNSLHSVLTTSSPSLQASVAGQDSDHSP